MKTKLIAGLILAASCVMAAPRIAIGVGVGVPVAPAPVYVAPAPVYYGHGYLRRYYARRDYDWHRDHGRDWRGWR